MAAAHGRMPLGALRVFEAVASSLNFSAAADALNLGALSLVVAPGWNKQEGVEEGEDVKLVLGGPEGSPFLNEHTPELLVELKSLGLTFGVRHLTGICDPEPVRRGYAARGVEGEVSGR